MPLLLEHPDASIPTQRNLGRYIKNAERIFRFPDSEGDFISNGIISHDQFTSVLDGDPVIRRFRNMTINTGHTVTPTQRCKGMYLLIEGDLTVNGTLSMTARGAKSPGKFVGVDHLQELIYFDDIDKFSPLNIFTIGKIGGLGVINNTTGNHGVNNACASGGGGYIEPQNGATGGHSGSGTSFSGGSGGGSGPRGIVGNGVADGGAGGKGVSVYIDGYWWTGGGGAGNPGGAGGGNGGTVGSSGTGGLIILVVKGNIIFGANGRIISAGSKGGAGYESGAGSGGGAIHLFHKGTISNPEKVTAPGGVGGDRYGVSSYPGQFGKNGGNGSISINKF